MFVLRAQVGKLTRQGNYSLHILHSLFSTYSTTGNACFAEDLKICRGPNLGHSAKTLFAEGQTQEPSAKNGPRQRGLCRGYGPRQRQALGKDVLGKLGPLGHGGHFPSSFAEGHPLGPRQRFFIFFKKILCRGPRARPSAIFFCFFSPVFCGATIQCFELNFKI